MHKSKLAGFIIDCKTGDLPSAASFWGQALGMQVREFPAPESDKYIGLKDPKQGLQIEVQSVDHESRVHLDIETDDIQAEVARLEQLGASQVGYCGSWCVMQAPTGQKFCVINRASVDFEDKANAW
jgi:predicted enzyme related to lactoylglutathione lyase